MRNDDAWKAHAKAFGGYLRKQRTLAELSLRDLAAQTQVSNAYLSQIERGLHQPSIRVLRALAEALKLPPDLVLAHAGLLRFADNGPIVDYSTLSDGAEQKTEAALLADPRLTRTQKLTLIAVYRSYLYPNSETMDALLGVIEEDETT